MSFFEMLEQKVEEEKKTRSSKTISELDYDMRSNTIKPPALGTGSLWRSLDQHEKEMADLYSLGTVNNARDLYYDKNSHSGTKGNIYKKDIY